MPFRDNLWKPLTARWCGRPSRETREVKQTALALAPVHLTSWQSTQSLRLSQRSQVGGQRDACGAEKDEVFARWE